MKKKYEKPRIMPDPLPEKPGVVEPIIAAGEMKCPPKSGRITSDVDGSYTGLPIGGGQPVQDADDL
ncbi:MAG: hypothetical protein IJO42_04470 [Clostridia bacterium]|nr:hypothetical protein [Clostridia bacterium]